MKWLLAPPDSSLIAASILGILSPHMYDSYRCIENFFKALTCLLAHNIWRIHVYAPKPHLTFPRYDESLMMTSIGFYIFGPQINKVVRGVGQRLSRGVCQRVYLLLRAGVRACVCLWVCFQTVTPSKRLQSVGANWRPSAASSPACHSGAGRIVVGFPSFFFSSPPPASFFFFKQSLPARLWEFHPLLIRSTDEGRKAQWGRSILAPHMRREGVGKKKKYTALTANSAWYQTRKYLFFIQIKMGAATVNNSHLCYKKKKARVTVWIFIHP